MNKITVTSKNIASIMDKAIKRLEEQTVEEKNKVHFAIGTPFGYLEIVNGKRIAGEIKAFNWFKKKINE